MPPIECPLQFTQVEADVAGMASRVTVVQTFMNPSRDPIEAIYTFPLPADASVDRMRIKIGDRVVEGEIKPRGEARAIYESARAAGQTAALLDQERPNIFTQSIANVAPGAVVEVEISYISLLKYEDGQYEFDFPMVVGPRNAMHAPDPDSITPPIVYHGMRTGTDVALTVHLNAGTSLKQVGSTLHAININKLSAGRYDITLARKDEIPNRDFILKWTPAGNGVTEGLITDSEGSFCLTVLPPRGDVEQYAAPREVDFVIDQSGSQEGYPLAKSKELTLAMIDKLRPDDVFNIVTFTTSVNKLWPEPVPNTPERVNEAKQFVRGLTAGGGTDLLPPLKETMSAPANDGRTKIVVFNSDGYVGDDFNVLAMVHKNQANARLFTFGIGDSVNRFLIDQMSAEGRGDSEIVTLASDADPAVARFLKRTQTPILTDVTVTATGTVHDLTPNPVPDLFADRPLLIFGRYDKSGAATVTIGGRLNGQPWSRTIDIDFPATENSGDGVTKVWARHMLDDMVRQDWIAATRTVTRGQEPTTDDSRYADFALKYGIMSQWTSFVAVEKRVVNIGGVQRTVRVPVEMAEGVSYDGVFGRAGTGLVISNSQNGPTVTIHGKQGTTTGGGGGTTGGGGFGGGGAAVQYNRAQAVDRLKAPSDKSAHPELKIHKDLRDKKKGTFEVQILLHDLPEEWDKALKDAGLEIADSDKGLKVVFGTVEAKHLMDLAKLDFVDQILPLDGS